MSRCNQYLIIFSYNCIIVAGKLVSVSPWKIIKNTDRSDFGNKIANPMYIFKDVVCFAKCAIGNIFVMCSVIEML